MARELARPAADSRGAVPEWWFLAYPRSQLSDGVEHDWASRNPTAERCRLALVSALVPSTTRRCVDIVTRSRMAVFRVQRRYASMTGATSDTNSSMLAAATASAFTTWRSIAMPISCAATSDARSCLSG